MVLLRPFKSYIWVVPVVPCTWVVHVILASAYGPNQIPLHLFPLFGVVLTFGGLLEQGLRPGFWLDKCSANVTENINCVFCI